MSTESITVKSIGPRRETLVIPIQPGGTVIRGYCGTGKSYTLQAIRVALGGDGKLKPTRGAKTGEVECCGVRLSVGQSRVTRTGEPDCACLEDFDIEDLIYPPRKGEDEKQRYGISALLRITGAKADPSLFYELACGKEAFDKLLTPQQATTDDLVELAGRVKRAFDAKARDAVADAEREEAKAAAMRNAGDGIDLNACDDTAKLQANLESAARMKGELDAQAQQARKAKADAEAARAQLARATGAADSIAELEAARQRTQAAENEASDEMLRLSRELDAAKTRFAAASVANEAQKRTLAAAKRTEAATAGWQAAIDAAADVYEPSADELAMVAASVEKARTAIETAAVVREAKRKVAQAKQHQEAAAEHRRAAMLASESAKGTWEVLSRCIASERFSVVDGVLMGKLPGGEVKPYYEESDGERAMIAVAEKIETTRATEPDGNRLAIVDLGQRIFQDLPASVQDALFDMAARMRGCVVTAQVDDGPLRAEVWKP